MAQTLETMESASLTGGESSIEKVIIHYLCSRRVILPREKETEM